MKFDPRLLPPTVYEAFKQGPIAWVFVIQVAIDMKITSLNQLTDIAFYLHNPDLKGRPLHSYEKGLISQWQGFRTLIKPILASSSKETMSKGSGSVGKPSICDVYYIGPDGRPVECWSTNGKTSKNESKSNSEKSQRGYYHPHLVDSDGNPFFIPFNSK